MPNKFQHDAADADIVIEITTIVTKALNPMQRFRAF